MQLQFPSNPTTPRITIVKKNFSLLLALRYLNPLRTHASVITLISLLGVSLGVMVLIVVLSVFGGFEQLIKDRVLSYTPHIYIDRISLWPDSDENPEYNVEEEWRSLEHRMSSVEGIKSSYALVNDYVILDQRGAVAPVSMQAIDTMNSDQTTSLQKLIKKGNGTADMGLGDTVVVSSITAREFGIQLGDTIQIHSSRNLQEVRPALERLDSPPVAISHRETLELAKEHLLTNVSPDPAQPDQELIPISKLKAIYEKELLPLLDLNLRSAEISIIDNVLISLEEGQRSTPAPDDSGNFIFKKDHIASAVALLDSLHKVNTKEEDISDMKNMKSLVLPKDLYVVGIYQATPHAVSPSVFVPLPVGQDLTALGDGVRGIALILDDPYDANAVIKNVIPAIPRGEDWEARTWMHDHQAQLSWIKTQRQLLSFSISFIMLVSAFSIMAVMFTVTVQKKREIGVMKALGATPNQLIKVFLYQGVFIGFIGGLLGLAAGLLVIKNLNHILTFFEKMGFDPFPSEINGFEGLPAIIKPSEFVGVFIFAFIMCIIATFVPALIASRSDAAKSLRNM